MKKRLPSCLILVVATAALARPALAQCTVTLNEINYDCALRDNTTDDCEFIELRFMTSASRVYIDECGATDIFLVNGEAGRQECDSYSTIHLPHVAVPQDGYFVIGKAGVANVDYTPPDWPALGSAIQNAKPGSDNADWVLLHNAVNRTNTWFAYEYDARVDPNCAGLNLSPILLGTDDDPGVDDGSGPTVREESVSLCSDREPVYLGQQTGTWSGPAATPGALNACERLPWPTDAGTAIDAGAADAATSVDGATATDGASAVDAGSAIDGATGGDAATGVDAATGADGAVALDSSVATDAGTAVDSATAADGAAPPPDATALADAAADRDASTGRDAVLVPDAAVGTDTAGGNDGSGAHDVPDSGCGCATSAGASADWIAALGAIALVWLRRRRG